MAAVNLFSLACWVFGWSICAQAPDPLVAISGPRDLVQFELLDGRGEEIWVITADPPRTPEAIHHGVVPAGFSQRVPDRGNPPRDLVHGEPVTLKTTTLRRVFVHHGVAIGKSGLLVERYSMTHISPKTPVP